MPLVACEDINMARKDFLVAPDHFKDLRMKNPQGLNTYKINPIYLSPNHSEAELETIDEAPNVPKRFKVTTNV